MTRKPPSKKPTGTLCVGKARGTAGLLGLVFLVAGLTGAHLYVNSQGLSYAGPLLVLDHAFSLMLVLSLFAICAAIGTSALARFGFRFNQPLEALLFSTALGGGFLSTSILICGLLSGFQRPILGLLFFSFALLSQKELRGLPVIVLQSFSTLKTNSGALSLAIFGIVALLMTSQALAPPLDWDSLMYHLRIPAQFLQHGRIYLPEDNLHTAFVQLAHMLYVPLLAFGSPAGPALASTVFALALGLAVFAFCLRFLNAATAGLALPLLWGSTFLLLVAITPRVDVTLAYYLFLAHYALLIALSDPGSRRFFFLSAALLGFGFGIKYSALLYVLALSPLIFWVARSRFQGLIAASQALFFFSLLAIGTALPWLMKNWILHTAPVYPYFTARGIEPWLSSLSTEQSMALRVSEVIREWHRQVSIRFNLMDLFLAPGRLTVEDEAAFYSLNPIFLALPLWLLSLRNRTLNWLMIPSLCFAIGVIVYYPENNLRYLIPAVAPFTIVATHLIETLGRRMFSARPPVWFSALVMAVALLPSGKNAGLWLSKTAAVTYLTGLSSRETYLRTSLVPAGSPAYADITFYVNRHLPHDSRVLMLLEARGYYFDVPVIQDNTLTNWSLLARTDAAHNCLQSTGISHVIANVSALIYYTRRGLDPHILQWESFQQFAERCLTPVYQGRGFILYRVSA